MGETLLEYCDGTMFGFSVMGKPKELLKGSDIGVDVTFLHAELLKFFFHIYSLSQVREGVVEGLFETVPMAFIVF